MRTTLLVLLLSLALFEVSARVVHSRSVKCRNRGWIQIHHNGSCYYLTKLRYNWADAVDFCSREGGASLLVLDDKDERHYVVEELRNRRYQSVWLGISDLDREGVWRLESNHKRIKYSDWSSENPDNYDNKEHCAEIERKYHYHWNDWRCDGLNGVICETRPLWR